MTDRSPQRRSSSALACLVAAALAGAPPRASASPWSVAAIQAPEDVVHLRDGGLVRGRILELLPGISVTITSAADGQNKTFPWDQVEAVERADGPPIAAVEPVVFEVGSLRVTIEVDRPVEIRLTEVKPRGDDPGAAIGTRVVCVSPCGRPIAARGRSFHLEGDGMSPSAQFSLDGYEGEVVAQVRAGSRAKVIGGGFMAAIGVAMVIGGLVPMLAAITTPREEFDRPERVLSIAGGVVLGGGIGLLVGGLVLAARGQTRLRLRSRPSRGP